MGGSGSGNRRRYGVKSTTKEHPSVDVRELERAGALLPYVGSTLCWKRWDGSVKSVEILATHDGVTFAHGGRQYLICLERTACNFGGSRIWFRCLCGRRAAILYLDGRFACRRCQNVAFASSREDVADRAIRRADKLRKRLRWVPGIANGVGSKPKWMRWHTYDRLAAEHTAMVGRYVQARTTACDW